MDSNEEITLGDLRAMAILRALNPYEASPKQYEEILWALSTLSGKTRDELLATTIADMSLIIGDIDERLCAKASASMARQKSEDPWRNAIDGKEVPDADQSDG